MCQEQLNSLVALKFAEDYGKFITKYFNSPWQSLTASFPKYDFSNVPSVFTETIGIVSVRGPILRLMHQRSRKSVYGHSYIFQKLSPFGALLYLKQQAKSLLDSSKLSFLLVCAMITKVCHTCILTGRSEMLYIPLMTLADIIIEERIALTLKEWKEINNLAIKILIQQTTLQDLEQGLQRKASESLGLVDYSTFWGQ